MKTAQVNAVHEDDAEALLGLLDVADDYKAGRLECSVCGTSLLENGLGAARRSEAGFKFACARLDCLDEFYAT